MAVVKKHILATLESLDGHYNTAPTTEATYYSKLAIIELCGWLEFTVDSIAEYYANKKLRTIPYRDIFSSIKQNTFGFDYKKHFRKMLYQTIGLPVMEKIERKINNGGLITILDTELDNLKILRDDAAHTYIDATKTYQAPSVTKTQLTRIYPILKLINKEVRAL